MKRPSWAPEGIDIERPSPARMYDYVLGGSHNFAVDRELCAQAMQLMPDLVPHVHGSRAFLRRAVGFCVEAGLRQFLDLGSGIPTRGNVHEIVQRTAPDARVMYIDIDPVAVVHSREILAGDDRARVLQADLRQPEQILAHPDVRGMLDFDRPIAVLMVGVLHFIMEEPTGIVAAFQDAVVPGSYLAMTHLTPETRPAKMAEAMKMSQRGGLDAMPRSRAEVERLVAGFELVEPGLVWAHEWHPDPPHGQAGDLDQPFILGCVGRKP